MHLNLVTSDTQWPDDSLQNSQQTQWQASLARQGLGIAVCSFRYSYLFQSMDNITIWTGVEKEPSEFR